MANMSRPSETHPTSLTTADEAGTASAAERKSIELTRLAENHYRATNPAGASVEFGRGEGLLTPVELLLAGLAGCSSIDVDTVTSRRSEPQTFRVTAAADKLTEDGDATRLGPITVTFDLAFPEDAAGRQAQGMITRLLALSHEKYCAVSRTLEHGTPVHIGTND